MNKELLETELKCITRVDTCNGDWFSTRHRRAKMGNKKISYIQRSSRKTRKEVTMTNRVYLRTLSNDKLAELLNGFKIFDLDCLVCEDGNCTKCVTKWLEAERKPNVEEGQIREVDSHKWLVGSINENRDTCGMLSEEGVIRDFPTDVVDTWKIVTDGTEEMFYNKAINNSLYNNKEINK